MTLTSAKAGNSERCLVRHLRSSFIMDTKRRQVVNLETILRHRHLMPTRFGLDFVMMDFGAPSRCRRDTSGGFGPLPQGAPATIASRDTDCEYERRDP